MHLNGVALKHELDEQMLSLCRGESDITFTSGANVRVEEDWNPFNSTGLQRSRRKEVFIATNSPAEIKQLLRSRNLLSREELNYVQTVGFAQQKNIYVNLEETLKLSKSNNKMNTGKSSLMVV